MTEETHTGSICKPYLVYVAPEKGLSLPQNAQPTKIQVLSPQYLSAFEQFSNARGDAGIVLPFKGYPSKNDVEQVAYHLARFVKKHTGITQDVSDFTLGDNRYDVLYLLKDTPGYPFRNDFSNYEIRESPFHIPGLELGDLSLAVLRQKECKHDRMTLDAYVKHVGGK